MHINLSPQRRATPLSLSRAGDVLTIDGVDFDFGDLEEGELLPRAAVDCDLLVSDVERIDGRITLTLILPHGPYAPEQTVYPDAIVDPDDGAIPLPPFDGDPPSPIPE